jgi:hypothetical protein
MGALRRGLDIEWQEEQRKWKMCLVVYGEGGKKKNGKS